MRHANRLNSEDESPASAPNWVPIAAGVVTAGVVLWLLTRVVPDFTYGSLAATGVVAVLVYGTAYACFSLASRSRRT